MRPSKRCSVSIELLPSCAASYRAKKITRLARSVYRSNMFSTRSWYAYYTTARKILHVWWFLHMRLGALEKRTENSTQSPARSKQPRFSSAGPAAARLPCTGSGHKPRQSPHCESLEPRSVLVPGEDRPARPPARRYSWRPGSRSARPPTPDEAPWPEPAPPRPAAARRRRAARGGASLFQSTRAHQGARRLSAGRGRQGGGRGGGGASRS